MGRHDSDTAEPPAPTPPSLGDSVPPARRSRETVDLLTTRRSTLAKLLDEPGPDESELKSILTVGARVPDHRRLTPWRFVVIRGDARRGLRARLEAIYEQTQRPDSHEEREKAFEKLGSIERAPVTICVVSSVRSDSPKARKTPEWEQYLSAGAVCQNLLIAASATGYAAQWVTEWYAYEPLVRRTLGLAEHERVAGFVFMGTATQQPLERTRSELVDVVQFWTDAAGKL